MVGLKTNNMKQYIAPLLRVGALALLLLTIYEQNNVITEYKATKSKFVADTLVITYLISKIVVNSSDFLSSNIAFFKW